MESLKFREKLFYGTGSLGKDFLSAMFTTYLLVFYTDVFGMSAAIAGMLLMAARIWDACANPIIGTIVDRTRTKWGRFRPYILFVPIPFALFTVLTFTVPDLGVTGKIMYAYVTYILAGTFFTFYDVSLWSMVPSLTTNLEDRNSAIAFARLFTFVAILIVSAIAVPAIKTLGGSSAAHGYFLFTIIVSVISILFAWLTFFNTKERVVVTEKPVKVKEHVQVLWNNSAIYTILISVVTVATGLGFSQTVGVYYMTYYLKLPELIPVYMILTLISSIAGILTANTVAGKLGNKKASFYPLALSIIPLIIAFFLAQYSAIAFLILATLASFLGSIPFVTSTGLVAETVDITEYKTGIRADGLIFSLNSFAVQLGLALSAGITGFVLQAVGYIPNGTNQTEATIFWINMLRTIIPVMMTLIGVVAVKVFPFDKEEYEEINKELKIRHAGNTEQL